jgi:hypothetical protein
VEGGLFKASQRPAGNSALFKRAKILPQSEDAGKIKTYSFEKLRKRRMRMLTLKGIRLRIFGNGLVARLAAALGSEVDSRFVSQ